MALRIAGPVYLTRSANLPPATAYTLMGWAIVPTGQSGTLVSVTGATGGPEFYYNYVVGDGKYYFGSYNGGAFPGNDFASGLPGADVWFHWYVKRSGNTLEAGFRTVGQTSYTVHQITLSTSPAWSALHLNTDPFNNLGDANYAAIKLWDAALSADQIMAESFTIRPQVFASLNLFAPMIDVSAANGLLDFSGGGRDWAATGGSPSVAQGPPVSWGA